MRGLHWTLKLITFLVLVFFAGAAHALSPREEATIHAPWTFEKGMTIWGGQKFYGLWIDNGNLVVNSGDLNLMNANLSLLSGGITLIGTTANPSNLVLTKGSLTVTSGAITHTTGNHTITNGDLTLTSGSITLTGQGSVAGNGGLTLTSGSVTVTNGDVTLTGGQGANPGNLTLTAGSLIITSGTVTHTTGNHTITNGDLTLTNGNLTVGGTLSATIVRTIDLPLPLFVVDSGGSNFSQISASTAPGFEIDDNAMAVVWADGETAPISVTFKIPNDYSSGGAFRVIATESNSTTPSEIDFQVFVHSDGSLPDTSATNQTPVAMAGTTNSNDVVTLTPVTDFASLTSSNWVTFEFWRDDSKTGTQDFEARAAQFFYTATQ